MSDSEKVSLPKELTAGNGAKYIMSGEFHEEIHYPNPDYCGCGECDHCRRNPMEPEVITEKVQVSWSTIKQIYKRIVEAYSE